MGILLWPVALLAFLAWSLAAWIAFGLSDWLAGLLGTSLAGLLTADLGPWAAWLLASLGKIVQAVIMVVWAVVGLFLLASPVLLRRRRRAEAMAAQQGGDWVGQPQVQPIPQRGPAYGGYRPAPAGGHGFGWRRDHDHDDDDDDDRGKRRWRDREAWRRRFEPAMGDFRDLRGIASDMAGRYRGKKWRRKRDDDDD